MKAAPVAVQLDAEAFRFYQRPERLRFRREVLPSWFASLAIILPILALFARGPYRWPARALSLAPAALIALVFFGGFGSAWPDVRRGVVAVRARTGRRTDVPFGEIARVILGPEESGRHPYYIERKSGGRVYLGTRSFFTLSVCRALAAHIGCAMEIEGRVPPSAVFASVRRFLACRGRMLSYVLYINRSPYRTWTRPKRSGGTRELAAPIPPLKDLQRRLLARILSRMDTGPHAHGFVRGRSIVTNARSHVGKPVVVHLDLKDFFPTVTFGRVVGLLRSQCFTRAEAVMLARVATWQGRLPQGAPSSPALANMVCRRLDRRLAALGRCFEADYTRYADDLVFSGTDRIRKLIPIAKAVAREEGFALAEHKLGVFRRHRRQRVTGLVVNERVSVPRNVRRWVRAVVHNCRRNGIAAENRRNDPLFEQRIRGYIEFIRMIHPEEGAELLGQWQKAVSRTSI